MLFVNIFISFTDKNKSNFNKEDSNANNFNSNKEGGEFSESNLKENNIRNDKFNKFNLFSLNYFKSLFFNENFQEELIFENLENKSSKNKKSLFGFSLFNKDDKNIKDNKNNFMLSTNDFSKLNSLNKEFDSFDNNNNKNNNNNNNNNKNSSNVFNSLINNYLFNFKLLSKFGVYFIIGFLIAIILVGYFISFEIALVILISIILVVITIIQMPKIKSQNNSLYFSRELPYALRQLSTELKSGKSLFNALESVVNADYGVLSNEFSRTLEEIKYGETTEKAFINLENRIKSEALSRVIREILSTLRIGGNLANSLSIIAEDINFEMRMKLKDYAQRLNAFIMIYTFIAILAPVVLLTLLLAASTVLGDFVPGDLLLILYGVFFPMLIIFLGFMIKKLEPKL